MLIFGWWLASKFRRRYKDLRDYEPLVFGIPAMLFAILLLMAWAGLMSRGLLGDIPQWAGEVAVFLIQLATVLAKAIFFCAFFIWVRWTLPRFRYDQLMNLGWKVMIPLGVANVAITSAVMAFH
jgi:NADH-quinone oxidoreductase subunit H